MLFTKENFEKIMKIKNGKVFIFKEWNNEGVEFLKYNNNYCLKVDNKYLSLANFSRGNNNFETKVYPYYINYNCKELNSVGVFRCRTGIDVMPAPLVYSSIEEFKNNFEYDRKKYNIKTHIGEAY